MRESDFIRQLRALLGTPVRGMDRRRKADLLERVCGQLRSDDADAPVEIEWVPFVTGRRPTDEAAFPGLGSSDKVALILGRENSRAYLLYRFTRAPGGAHEYEVRLSLSMAGPWGDVDGDALPQWNARTVPPLVFEAGGSLVPVDLELAGERCLVVALSEDDFRDGTFGFGSLFLQQVRAELVLLRDGAPVSASEMMIDVCDGRAIGGMYPRVIEKVIGPDTERQGSAERAHHPWFPVLLIGSAKTDLYMRALVEDIVEKQRHLTDAGWLLRIGIYLELLTCLGIADAVRPDVGDILTAEERQAYEASPWFAPIREAVNVRRWKEVWDLRSIAASQPMNLLNKKKATVAFLEAHHEDLKHAIRLAGPNDHNAQETWHRVFRDAERAVLRKMQAAFPELEAFPPAAREFVLWHQKGKIGSLSLPGVSSWFGDQDGLFASACNQYRASMNHVAEWAKGEGLMDHTGSECIPSAVSLLTAVMEGKHVRIAQLQRRDGYPDPIELPPEMTPDATARRETVASLFRSVSIFKVLTDEEVEKIVASARPIELGPVERIIVQGRKGTSLFIVAEGNLEVMVRQKDGVDLPVAILQPGSVFGEMSLLTGQRRSATVRSIESALVYEVGQQQLGPILRSRPDAVNELAAVMEPRLRVTAGVRSGYEARKGVVSLGEKIRSFLLS